MTANWETVGHPRAIQALSQGIKTGRVANAWLLLGQEHVGKTTLAFDIARMVNCIAPAREDRPCANCKQCQRISKLLHADLRIISPGGNQTDSTRRTSISIEQIQEMQSDVILKPYEGLWRVYVIEDAHLLTNEAANAMLKVLEEPPSDTVFVLLATRILEMGSTEPAEEYSAVVSPVDKIARILSVTPEVNGILPTISSRCQMLELRPIPTNVIQEEILRRFNIDIFTAEDIARLSSGRLGWAIECASEPKILEKRLEKLRQITALSKSGISEKFAYAEQLAGVYSNDRQSVYEELELWTSWWRDVLMVREGNPGLVINTPTRDIIGKAAEETASTQIVEIIRSVERTSRMLERNVNTRLCLEHLVLQL